MNFEFKDVLNAYKKVKREVYHENLQLSIRYFMNYEKELEKNY